MNRRNLQISNHFLMNIEKGIDRTNSEKSNFKAKVIEVLKDKKHNRDSIKYPPHNQWQQLELVHVGKENLTM